MNKADLAIFLILAVAAVAQVSFAPHFGFFSGQWFTWLNFATVAAAVIVLFEKPARRRGWFAAVFCGFFLDIYSSGTFFGFWIMALLALTAFIKLIVKKYVRIPSFW